MVNKVTLIGRMGKDPDIRYINKDLAVGRFSLATTEVYRDSKGAKQEDTQWHDIVVWRDLAKAAEKYFKRGMLVYVEGKLSHRQFEDENGNKRRVTEIVASTVKIIDWNDKSASHDTNPAPAPESSTETYPTEVPEGDTLPF